MTKIQLTLFIKLKRKVVVMRCEIKFYAIFMLLSSRAYSKRSLKLLQITINLICHSKSLIRL